jgi:hypothetical protein
MTPGTTRRLPSASPHNRLEQEGPGRDPNRGQVSRIDNGRRLRVLVVIHHLSVGGSQRCAVDLAIGVHKRGHDVTVAGPPGPLADLLVDDGVPFVPLENDRPARPWARRCPATSGCST